MPRLAGVPPNMSVTISTPFGPGDRGDRLADLAARVLDVLVPADRHRDDVRQIADDGLGGVDAARSASCPWVTTTTPIMPPALSRPTSRCRTRAVTPGVPSMARRSASAM